MTPREKHEARELLIRLEHHIIQMDAKSLDQHSEADVRALKRYRDKLASLRDRINKELAA